MNKKPIYCDDAITLSNVSMATTDFKRKEKTGVTP